MTVDQIIESLGGTNEVARHFGREPSVVTSWRRVGYVPHWHVGPLVEYAKSKDVALAAGDVPVREQRKTKQAA